MFKKLIVLLSLSFFIFTVGCSSKDVDDVASQEGEFSDDFFGDDFGDFDSDVAGTDPFSDDFFGDGEGTGDDDFFFDDSSPTDDFAVSDSEPLDDPWGMDDPFATDSGFDAGDSAADPFAASGDPFASDSFSDDDDWMGLTPDPEPEPKPERAFIPLRKMELVPYRDTGILVNGLYFAREGDTLVSISDRIYGEDKTDELKTINRTYQTRDVRVGDKVYYNSPQRPNDDGQILLYFEELGLSPLNYVSSEGENIREISERLLGHSRSWFEVWSYNLDVESKRVIPAGTRLRYWPADALDPSAPAPAPTMARQQEQIIDDFPELPEEAPMPAPAPPPREEETMAVAPPPPPPPPAPSREEAPPAIGSVAEAPPPPPPPAQTPPSRLGGAAASAEGGSWIDDEMATMGIGVLLILAAVAIFVIIRKRRSQSKNIDFQTATHTHIE